MSKKDSAYLKRSNMTNWHSFIPSTLHFRNFVIVVVAVRNTDLGSVVAQW